jgi:hypothetical protein
MLEAPLRTQTFLLQASLCAGARRHQVRGALSSDDLKGLAELRKARPLAAGAYGYDLGYFENMLRARAVDVLQAA